MTPITPIRQDWPRRWPSPYGFRDLLGEPRSDVVPQTSRRLHAGGAADGAKYGASNHRGPQKANIISYCIGGTLIAAALAYLPEKGNGRVASVTFRTSIVDFAEPGELGGFIDEG